MSKHSNFSSIVYKKGMLPNLISAGLICAYASCSLFLRFKRLKPVFILVGIIVVIAEFIFSPLTNTILTKKITEGLNDWHEKKLTDIPSLTKLFVKLAQFPLKKGIQTFLYFLTCSTLVITFCIVLPQIRVPPMQLCVLYSSFVFGSYIASLLAINYSEKICSPYCEQLLEAGIDRELINKKKKFGVSLGLRAILYLIVPLFFIGETLLLIPIQIAGRQRVFAIIIVLSKVVMMAFINAIIYIVLCSIFHKKIKVNAVTLADAIEEIIADGQQRIHIKTNLFDTMQYGIHLLNEIVNDYASLLKKAHGISQDVLNTTENLATISKELESTSMVQSADVQEISMTMMNAQNSLSNIATRLSNVSESCELTKTDVAQSFDVLRQSSEQMQQIESNNKDTTLSIHDLTQQIEKIGSVVGLITDIAEQTRIIAFNAELEAVSAGDKGKNFHIIAFEIRRLANSVMESIHEIQRHIDSIEQASHTLIMSSQNTTQYIQEGMEMSQNMENHFHNIQDSAHETFSQISEIKNITNQQTASFEQILATINQIKTSIQSFTGSTKSISNTATLIQQASAGLAKLH